jgi:hypothetical protein
VRQVEDGSGPGHRRSLRQVIALAAAGALVAAVAPVGAAAQPLVPPPRDTSEVCPTEDDRDFDDIAGSAHEDLIRCMAGWGLTSGLRGGDDYGPRLDVTRGQMAAFIARFVRAAGDVPLPAGEGDRFTDVPAGYAHRDDIVALAEVEVVLGTAASNGAAYAPQAPVSRAQMAAFIRRALSYLASSGAPPVGGDGSAAPPTVPPPSDVDRFPDDDGSIHERHIDALAVAGIVQGYADGTYRPGAAVKRDTMASFVMRAFAFAADQQVGIETERVRFATFNTALSDSRSELGQLLDDLAAPGSDAAADLRDIATIIQHQRPNVLQLGEFDFSGAVDGTDAYAAADRFRADFLEVGQDEQDPIVYPYAYVAPVNTGVASGFDLNRDGQVGGPDDAWGFGFFEGQYGMLVLSQYPIVTEEVRTFQDFRWADMPGALLPGDPETDEDGDWYSDEILDEFPLSSKSHWDVPVRIGDRVVHTLNAHPTPPAFDGPEQRNVLRNHDEVRLWADYLSPATSGYIYDDEELANEVDEEEFAGGLDEDASFVVLGDYNDDPCDGDGIGIGQLLDHPRVNTSITPASLGGIEQARLQGGSNLEHDCPPEHDTADFGDPPGNLRVDYALPSVDLEIADAGVFWPLVDDPWYEVVDTSDHRMVWVDVEVPTAGR